MDNQLSVLDVMRLRYMKGEPLLQVYDSFNMQEMIEAMDTINAEVKARGLNSPIAVRQPD